MAALRHLVTLLTFPLIWCSGIHLPVRALGTRKWMSLGRERDSGSDASGVGLWPSSLFSRPLFVKWTGYFIQNKHHYESSWCVCLDVWEVPHGMFASFKNWNLTAKGVPPPPHPKGLKTEIHVLNLLTLQPKRHKSLVKMIWPGCLQHSLTSQPCWVLLSGPTT